MKENNSALLKKWFPLHGETQEKIDKQLNQAQYDCIDYDTDPILGFPGTPPADIAVNVHSQFSRKHFNNIGYHTKSDGVPSEMGFYGTQRLEREFIFGVAEMIGVENPKQDIDGYICSGGTEGNDHGLWIARNVLWNNAKHEENHGIVVMRSFLSHYSTVKAFHRLMENPPNLQEKHRNILHTLPVNKYGELGLSTVEKELLDFYEKGYTKFAIFLTAGTTNMGSIDPIYDICEMISAIKEACGIDVYIHVDAAFGGFVIPFIEPGCRFAFQHSLVQSVSIDAHKTGWAPYSSGVFMCRKRLLESTKTNARYLHGLADYTVPGSRSGAIAAACWATLHFYGFNGFKSIVDTCMKNTKYLKDRLKKLPGVWVYNNRMNILAIRIPRSLEHVFKNIHEDFCIVEDDFSTLTEDNQRSTIKEGYSNTVYRFTVMPHVTIEKIDYFFKKLLGSLK